MPVHKSIQTTGPIYLFNWVALTGGGDVITLTKLNVRNVEKAKKNKTNKHYFSDTVGINLRDKDITISRSKTGKT